MIFTTFSRLQVVARGGPNIKSHLAQMFDALERLQKALNEFLERKRSLFPRFYFLGDDDLLEILGQAQNPPVIQAHLKKLFQGINYVQFDQDQKHILAMCSLEGEVVKLVNAVRTTEHVEGWLADLAKEMKNTLQTQLVENLKSSGAVQPQK